MSNVETCTFDELAQLLNDELDANYLGGRGVAKSFHICLCIV